MRKSVSVIGVGDDGCLSLGSLAAGRVAEAGMLVGGERLLAYFPQFTGKKLRIGANFPEVLDLLKERSAEENICVLASGDPLFFGVAAAIIEGLGKDEVEVIPHPSSMQLAFAKLGEKWDDASWISLHGRTIVGLVTRLRRHRKVVILTDHDNSPARIAAHMVEFGALDWQIHVFENLGGVDEKLSLFSVQELALSDGIISPLNLLILKRRDALWQRPAHINILEDGEYFFEARKNGLITKKEARLIALSALGIRPDAIVWDIGAGSGSVGIEAAMMAETGEVWAVEKVPERIDTCYRNLRRHGVDNVHLVTGEAPTALQQLPRPNAVFIGGSGGNLEAIIDTCYRLLREDGRLVIHAVTLDSVATTYEVCERLHLQPEVTLLQVARLKPVKSSQLYEAMNPIHIFAIKKRC